jgi:hypothetical protein
MYLVITGPDFLNAFTQKRVEALVLCIDLAQNDLRAFQKQFPDYFSQGTASGVTATVRNMVICKLRLGLADESNAQIQDCAGGSVEISYDSAKLKIRKKRKSRFLTVDPEGYTQLELPFPKEAVAKIESIRQIRRIMLHYRNEGFLVVDAWIEFETPDGNVRIPLSLNKSVTRNELYGAAADMIPTQFELTAEEDVAEGS